jgi:osmotically-inducible protein OsmY
MKQLAIIIALFLTLQGCIFIAGTAAGVAAVGVVNDHRKLEQISRDTQLNNAIVKNIKATPELFKENHINVVTFNQIVLLAGETTTAELRQAAENAAREAPNAIKIYNQIEVKGSSSVITRTSDAWITAKIKTQMLAAKALKSGNIKVITENGSVYLLGQVSHDQAEMAVNIARQVSGVQRVMKIFQYTE